IAGHLHPCARVAGRGRAVRRKCFATDGPRLILPALGAYTGGLNILGRAFTGLFDDAALMAHVLGDARLFSIARGMLLPDRN
ncbi:MAG: ligase-associated DNA damage response endonuclease PdeM, partial [Beijerinckiaceae bacterium]